MAIRSSVSGFSARRLMVFSIFFISILLTACGGNRPQGLATPTATATKTIHTVTPLPGPDNAARPAITATNPPAPTPSFTPPSRLPKVILDYYSYGSISSQGVTVVDGPLEASIPLESSKEGLKGQVTVIYKETASGGCNAVRTTEEVMEVTATGKDTLSFVIVWHATVLSTTNNCFGVPPGETITSEPVELPFVDGAKKIVNYPSSVGDFNETYTLHVK
jgi:hypothetical protein